MLSGCLTQCCLCGYGAGTEACYTGEEFAYHLRCLTRITVAVEGFDRSTRDKALLDALPDWISEKQQVAADLSTRAVQEVAHLLSSADVRAESLSWCGVDGLLDMWLQGSATPRHILALPTSLLHVRGLRQIQISHQPLMELPRSADAWLGLAGLSVLHIVCCLIREVPTVAMLPSLEVIALCQNQLMSLPDSIGQLPRLRSLNFTGNRIGRLPQPFALTMLCSLLAEGNELTQLPASLLSNCPMITELRLAGNPLNDGFVEERLDNESGASYQLCVAYWQGCSISKLPDFVVASSKSLMYLLLSENRLAGELPEAMSELPVLRWLYLYANQLTRLPQRLLSGCVSLSTCLLEANPLSSEAMLALVEDACSAKALRVLGLDLVQVHTWSSSNAVQVAMPACVQSGWLIANGRWYGKLIPSSQLSRIDGDPTLGTGDTLPQPPCGRGRVLFVAFAASQGEPEWAGQIGRLHRERKYKQALQHYVEEWGMVPLSDHVLQMQKRNSKYSCCAKPLATSLWSCFRDSRDNVIEELAEECTDFDVLLLVDPHRQWYSNPGGGSGSLDSGPFTRELAAVTSKYDRVCSIGASMGGFAALSHAHLVDAVLVFGPQIDLETAPYRPGFELDELHAATARLRQSVAGRRGSVECHVSMEAHLMQALQLRPLPDEDACGSASEAKGTLRLVVHPFKGRCARVLERAGLLLPLLAGTLHRLQMEATSCSPPLAHHRQHRQLEWPVRPGGDSAGGAVTVLVSRWSDWLRLPEGTWQLPQLRLLRATTSELRQLALEAPDPGDWLCTQCGTWQFQRQPRCGRCGHEVLGGSTDGQDASHIVVPGGDDPAFCAGDWECQSCERLEYRREMCCSRCGRKWDLVGVTSQTAEATQCCSNVNCCTRRADLNTLRKHPSDGKLYCEGCCDFWNRKHRQTVVT